MYSHNCAVQMHIPERAKKKVCVHPIMCYEPTIGREFNCTLLILSSTDLKCQPLNKLGCATCTGTRSTPAASRLLCQLICRAAIITTKLNASQTEPLSSTWRSCWTHIASFSYCNSRWNVLNTVGLVQNWLQREFFSPLQPVLNICMHSIW